MTRDSRGFSQFSGVNSELQLKFGHDRFLLHHFLFIIHKTFHQLTLCELSS
jgi:hypothetical protein